MWNSSKTLFRWIVEHLSITTWSTIRILELGSGCGLLAQALSMQGAEVIATDKVLMNYDSIWTDEQIN